MVTGECVHCQDASSFKTFRGNISLIELAQPLWVVLENVDLGNVADETSNGAMVRQALLDQGYACCIFDILIQRTRKELTMYRLQLKVCMK